MTLKTRLNFVIVTFFTTPGLTSNETLHPKVVYDNAVTVDSHYPYVTHTQIGRLMINTLW